jgi:hypothetical protein
MNQHERDVFVESAVRTLEQEWALDIWEPLENWINRANRGESAPDTTRWAKRIEDYMRASGPHWASVLQARAGVIRWRKNDHWCGFFANWGFVRAHLQPCTPQYRLHPQISHIIMPSTYRISSADVWRRAGLPRLNGLLIPAHDIQRGDVVTIETNSRDPKPYGDHFVVALSGVINGKFRAVEGNASGRKPTGPDTRQGVVLNERDVSRVRRVYRFQPQHFVKL